MVMRNATAAFVSLTLLGSLFYVQQTFNETKYQAGDSGSKLKSHAFTDKQQHRGNPSPWSHHIASLTRVPLKESNRTNTTTPLFMHVRKSGGTTMKNLGACLGLITADEHGQFSNQTASLDVVTWNRAVHFVNIDACTVSGIRTAHALGFASQQPAEAVYTPYIRDAVHYLFDNTHQAAVFGLFRDPIDQAVSFFYYLQHATWEENYAPEFQNITLKEYALNHVIDNYITRTIAGKLDDEDTQVTREEFELAKLFLKDFVLIGLTDQIDESMARFAQAFGWNRLDRWEACRRRASRGMNRFEHPQVKRGDEEWQLLAAKNEYDLELFSDAQELFAAQRDLFR